MTRSEEQQTRVDRLRALMDAADTWPHSHYGDYDYDHLTAIVDGDAHCDRWAAIHYDETYTFVYLFDTQEKAAKHLAEALGEETGGSIEGVVDLDTLDYYRAEARVLVDLRAAPDPRNLPDDGRRPQPTAEEVMAREG